MISAWEHRSECTPLALLGLLRYCIDWLCCCARNEGVGSKDSLLCTAGRRAAGVLVGKAVVGGAAEEQLWASRAPGTPADPRFLM